MDRSHLWPWMLAILTIFGLLWAFHQVMRGAVLQGELQRKASAVYAEARWRCNAARGPSLRDSCVMQLTASHEEDATRQSQDVATAGMGAAQLLP